MNQCQPLNLKPIRIKILIEIKDSNFIGLYPWDVKMENQLMNKYKNHFDVMGITYFLDEKIDYITIPNERYFLKGINEILNVHGISADNYTCSHPFQPIGTTYIFFRKT